MSRGSRMTRRQSSSFGDSSSDATFIHQINKQAAMGETKNASKGKINDIERISEEKSIDISPNITQKKARQQKLIQRRK